MFECNARDDALDDQTTMRGVRSLTRLIRIGLIVLLLLIVVANVAFFSSSSVPAPTLPAPLISPIQRRREGGVMPVLRFLRRAGVRDLSQSTIDKLPKIEDIEELYGSSPILVGLERCSGFQASVPAVRRSLGAAGLFSSGTNLVTKLLKQNCVIPERRERYGPNATKEQLGIRWQVPYGKHTDERFRTTNFTTAKAAGVDKHDVLPVVVIRQPWRWMQSMCKNPYAARWDHAWNCPYLKDGERWHNVTVKYGAGEVEYQSLVHLWNDWYRLYLDADYPRIMIRMEDLVFYAQPTITAVCQCAGGVVRDDFRFVVDSAKKDSPGHDTSIGLEQAWMRYSQPLEPKAGLTHDDYRVGVEYLDRELMQTFGYHHPAALAA